jgi:hypothetical protein
LINLPAKKVKDGIKQVIEEYECDPSVDLDNCDKEFNISFQLLWEMVKMKIRGQQFLYNWLSARV